MAAIAGLGGIGASVVCCGLLWVLFLVGLVIWYWRNQPAMEVSATAPEPVIQATIEHPTAAAPAAPATPAPPTASEPPVPPSADV
jgi:uncharacterized iron-regulated membrane protein